MGGLDGIKVVDLTRALAGPYCTMILGDHGAEVVKVELPGTGDETRLWAPPFVDGESAYYLSINRNKRSITLDLKRDLAKRVLERLIERSDVLVENFSPGTLARLGFAPDRVRAINPRLIHCGISGFGSEGPGRAWPAYDLIVQGMSGIQGLTGQPDGMPTMVGVPIADMVGGLYAVIGILVALHARGASGEGQYVDATMLGSMVSLLSRQGARYFATGESPKPEGNVHASIAPYQTFLAKDGYVNVAVGNNALFERFCRALGLDDLLDDERYADNTKRVKHRATLVPAVQKRIAELPKDDVVRRLREVNVPVGPIYSLAEVFADPAAKHLELALEVDHPTAGKVKVTGFPVRLSGTAPGIRRHPPVLGEHTDEVLGELGYAPEEIAELRRDGAV
ncbi:MAG TPA: CaiB/BaiF CoA-transferase family protein [Candidatus Dormibacteraeota bacterium]|jgi:crotonobetainyl-CoA:carnitine CoA-transferase CaiB-like acyl-CoA transferase|nr:CaiB/BaiF CoA-transferase family protein [Candidatus Dormibacteraeota bacterium]